MNIGLFGLSGVGKSYLASQLCHVDENLICVKASEIIKSYGHHIKYRELKHDVVEGNQLILIDGVKHFQSMNPNKDIIIELHNVIESPEGNIDINGNVLTQLNLDAACFIELAPKKILKQRLSDTDRIRHITSISALKKLQLHSKTKFIETFSSSSIALTTLNNNYFHGLRSFIALLRKESY